MKISLTKQEYKQEKLSKENLSESVKALRTDGYVVLEGVVAHSHLDTLKERMSEDLGQLMNSSKVPHNFVWGNVQQDPPPMVPFVFRDIVANPWAVQVTKALLGKGLFNSYYSGNTNLPGSHAQPVHVDVGHLWPNLEVAHPSASLVVNVLLDTVTEENGSVELWPGTHLNTHRTMGEDIKVDLDGTLLEARRKIAPPIRGNTQKGSILIRDIRLWHRGMPNLSDQPRFMIAMIHNCKWLRRNPLLFSKGCEDAFMNSDLDANALFDEQTIDYLYRNQPYDFEKKAT